LVYKTSPSIVYQSLLSSFFQHRFHVLSPGKIQHTVFLSFCEKNKKIKKTKKNRELDGQTVQLFAMVLAISLL